MVFTGESRWCLRVNRCLTSYIRGVGYKARVWTSKHVGVIRCDALK